jgi:hypothetical protein
VNVSDNRSYTLEATSRALVACGIATAQVTVNRTNFLALEFNSPHSQPNPSGQPIAAGNNGTFDVVFSCPLAQDVQIHLLSSDPVTLQVPSLVIIHAGDQRVTVQFTTSAPSCAIVSISAQVPPNGRAYVPRGPLTYDVYRQPVLNWAVDSPPEHVFEGVPFIAEVETECVPADPAFGVIWSVTPQTPPNGAAQALAATNVAATEPNRFQISFPALSPAVPNLPWLLSLAIRVA